MSSGVFWHSYKEIIPKLGVFLLSKFKTSLVSISSPFKDLSVENIFVSK